MAGIALELVFPLLYGSILVVGRDIEDRSSLSFKGWPGDALEPLVLAPLLGFHVYYVSVGG